MRARLGFAVAEEARPEILLLDEVHEALDHEFREIVAERRTRPCSPRRHRRRGRPRPPAAGELLRGALWLVDGRIAADGPFEEVRSAYLSRDS